MNETPALLFPGQGAQFPGMGQDWAEAFPQAAATFRQASAVLGRSVEDDCWRSGEDIHRTDLAQVGIFTTSAAIVRVLSERGLDPARVPLAAGLSLGEYSALWFAGALSFEDALRLVRLRGQAMQRASEQCPSSMLSLMGADEGQARTLAQAAGAAGICSVANLNAPGQVILSGELAALERAEALAKQHGIKRTRRLVVAGGFHSPCMASAQGALEAALAEVEIRPPRVRVISNVTADFAQDPAQIRALLAQQVCSSVLWEASMRRALAQGLRTFLEPGPGKVLAGLMGKIDPQVHVLSAAAPADLVSAGMGARTE
jgi:[acyl-carrier-protein] S-malonyltransferase